jgi:hypothetical protein
MTRGLSVSSSPGAARVVLQTTLGGERTLPELDDDPIHGTC